MPQTTTAMERISTFVAENITGRPDESEKSLILEAYTKTVNVFLRDLPLHRRAELAEEMLKQTSDWVNWETPTYAGGRMIKAPFGKGNIEKPRGFNEPGTLIHEAIHYLQDRGDLPYNYALTYAATKLVELEEVRTPFVGSNDHKGRVLVREGCSTEKYLNAVLQNTAHEYLVAPFVLRPDLETESDRYLRSLQTYLDNEERFNLMFSQRGEEDLPSFMGVDSPYNTMQAIGSARGNRAYALGYFTGDVRNAWTVLWLHGQGMKFEEAEKMIARAYLDGTIGDFNNYALLNAGDVERVTSMQEVFKTRKLSALEMKWVEQETGVCIFGKVRGWVANAKEKAGVLIDAVKATVRNAREMSKEELAQAQEVFVGWAGNHFYRDSITGKGALDLTELKPYLKTLITESVNRGEEYSSNVFVFPDQRGYLKARLLGMRRGFSMSALPRQYSKPFPENIGIAHAHYYAEYSGHSVPDLVEFVTHQGHFMSVLASTNGVYVLVKNPEFDDSNKTANRHALGVRLLRDYAENLRQENPKGEIDFVIAKAQELGLGVFAVENIENLDENGAFVLTQVD